jgi:predicted HicB family RNase H-like nuclease
MTTVQSHHAIQTNEVFDALKGPLALIDDPQRREDMQRFVDTARVHQERAVFDLISDIVARVNESSGDTKVRLEYQAREFRLTVDANQPAEDTSDPLTRMDGDLDKVTIRLPKALKDLIDTVAADRGVSLNSWYVRTLARGVAHQTRRMGGDPGAFGPPEGRGGGRRGGRGRFGGRGGREAD